MTLERLVRFSLWMTAPLNLVAGFAFAMPGSRLGQLLQLPPDAHPFYTLLCGTLVGLFGFAYAWLATRRHPRGALLCFGACGKLAAALLAITLGLQGALAVLPALLIGGDLLFAGLWMVYLASPREAR